MLSLCRFAAMLSAFVFAPVLAHATLITFDTYTAGTQITTQYAGVTFSGATVYAPGTGSAGAHSGSNEVIDASNSAIGLSFTTGQTQISGWYTSTSGITVSTYGAGSSSPLSTVSFSASSGQTAFSLSGTGITSLAIAPVSGTFTLDDLSYTAPPAGGSQTSEPASLLLLGTGLVGSSCIPGWRVLRRKATLAVVA